MSRRPRTSTRTERRLREWAVRGSVWLLILLFSISAVGALFILPMLARR
jgi:hypothetical protein